MENYTNILNETIMYGMEKRCEESEDITSFNFTEFDFPNQENMIKPFTWKEYSKIILYVVAIAAVMIGNIGVILAVALNRSLRMTINYYLANLAVADILICLFCMWVHLVNHLTEPLYVLGPVICKFNGFAQMLTLSAISCDRYIAIMFPLHVRVTKQRTGAVISGIWIISLMVSIPFLIYRTHYQLEWRDFVETNCIESWPSVNEFSEEKGFCVKSYPSKKIYYTFVTTTLFFIPVIVMITAYSLIVWRLWVNQMPGEANQANVIAQKKAKKKVIKMVCLVLIVFVICWSPLQFIVLYSQYIHSTQDTGVLPKWFSSVSYFAAFIAYSNSVFNPIIYGGFNKNFRQALCSMFRCENKALKIRRRNKSKKSSVCTAITWSPNGNKRNNDMSSPYKTDVIELNNMDSTMNC